jgi:FtsH-binding integral membrane protein
MPYAESSLLKEMKGGCNCGLDFSGLMKGGSKNGRKNGFFDLIMEKKQFLLLVFSNLLLQLGISYYLMMNYNGPHLNVWFILFATLGILYLIIFIPMSSFMKFLLFCIFSALLGINLSVINSDNNSNNGNNGKNVNNGNNGKNGNNGNNSKDIIHLAMLQTLSVFGAMFLVGAFLLATGIKLGFGFAGFLFYSLLFLILARLWTFFSGTINIHTFAFSVIGVLLFSLYIIYDTNIILRREYYGDFITASMDYYLDIINLFTNLFKLNNN